MAIAHLPKPPLARQPARMPTSWAEARKLAADFSETFVHAPRALALAWRTSPKLLGAMVLWTLLAGALPAAIAWVGRGLVDAVVDAQRGGSSAPVPVWVGIELVLVLLALAAQRGQVLCQTLLRAQLGHRIHVLIFDKALTLSLTQFEDSATYDLLTRARREASSRPLGLMVKLLSVLQQAVSLAGFSLLLVTLSPWAVVALVAAGMPAFLAEARFSGQAFRMFHYRAPEARLQLYLETLMAREDSAKEVQIYQFGGRLLQRYQETYEQIYAEDRDLAVRRYRWGLALAVVASLVLYGAFGWLTLEAAAGALTLGAMTAGLLAFKQGQQAFGSLLTAVGGLYEDNLYVSTLFELLDLPVEPMDGQASVGSDPEDGLRFCNVGFTYPGADSPALHGITAHIRPGQTLALVGANGSGKTTLIKLLARLYRPTQGYITLDGLDLEQWQPDVLRRKIGIIFQDFLRYQFLAGENIGVGDVAHFDDEQRWEDAAVRANAHDTLAGLPGGYRTQLGKWFDGGRELSGGQWQRVALARALMRRDAQILVLDEPTSAMDAAAEAEMFDHLQDHSGGRMCLLISHRFSTVRRADAIVVLDKGQVVEQGSHADLVGLGGTYARLFEQQALGYR